MASAVTCNPSAAPSLRSCLCSKQLADRVGLLAGAGAQSAGPSSLLFLVLAASLPKGSRLSAVRWAAHHAVAETLGLGRFDEDDLYAALDAPGPRAGTD